LTESSAAPASYCPEDWQKNLKFPKMWAFERLRKWHEEKTDSRKVRMECFFLDSGTVALDLRGDCVDWIPSRSTDQNTMKTRQPEFRAIPQFDCGRWKLRLERMPLAPDNETTLRMEFDSAAQARVNETNEGHWFLLPIGRGRSGR
jgi:hypothetical protein